MGQYPSSLLIKVAELYYNNKKSQKEISTLLKISPATVSRILQDALDTGVIKVEIVRDAVSYEHYEKELEKKYKLKKAVVIDVSNSREDWQIKKLLGYESKKVFSEIVEHGDKIGLGPGETIYEMILSFNDNDAVLNTKIIPLMGGAWSSSKLNTESSNLVLNMATVMRAEFYMLLAPAIVSSKATRDAFLNEHEIIQTVNIWNELDMAIFSIGPEIEYGSYKGHNKKLNSENIVGDIAGWIIDNNGCLIETDFNDRLISIPLDVLKKVPKRIAVGGGPKKYRSVKAVLHSGYATHLITDQNTALYILNNGG